MINQLIIILTDPQQKQLIKKMEAANMDDDHACMQNHINDWLKDDSERLDEK